MKLRQDLYLAEQPINLRGEIVHEMYIVVHGSVRVINPVDPTETLDVIHPGGFFGEISLMANVPRFCSIVAITNVDLLVLHADDFNSVLACYPEEGVLM